MRTRTEEPSGVGPAGARARCLPSLLGTFSTRDPLSYGCTRRVRAHVHAHATWRGRGLVDAGVTSLECGDAPRPRVAPAGAPPQRKSPDARTKRTKAVTSRDLTIRFEFHERERNPEKKRKIAAWPRPGFFKIRFKICLRGACAAREKFSKICLPRSLPGSTLLSSTRSIVAATRSTPRSHNHGTAVSTASHQRKHHIPAPPVGHAHGERVNYDGGTSPRDKEVWSDGKGCWRPN